MFEQAHDIQVDLLSVIVSSGIPRGQTAGNMAEHALYVNLTGYDFADQFPQRRIEIGWS